MPAKGCSQALPRSSPSRAELQQAPGTARRSEDTDCLRDTGVQAVNDVLQLFLHAWSLEQVLLPKAAQGWTKSPEAHGDSEVKAGNPGQSLQHRGKAPPCKHQAGADLQPLLNQVTKLCRAPRHGRGLSLTWRQACLNKWSTKSQISFGTCSGIPLASSLSREPIGRTDFSWWQRAHEVSEKPQSL